MKGQIYDVMTHKQRYSIQGNIHPHFILDAFARIVSRHILLEHSFPDEFKMQRNCLHVYKGKKKTLYLVTCDLISLFWNIYKKKN